MIYKGQNLRLKLGEKFIAFAKTCTLHVSADLITYDDSSKDDTTFSWKTQDVDQMGFDLSAEQLFAVDGTDTTGLQAIDVLKLMCQGKAIDFEFVNTTPQSEKNRVEVGTLIYGKVIINDSSIQANNKENGSSSLQAAGTEELKFGPKVA